MGFLYSGTFRGRSVDFFASSAPRSLQESFDEFMEAHGATPRRGLSGALSWSRGISSKNTKSEPPTPNEPKTSKRTKPQQQLPDRLREPHKKTNKTQQTPFSNQPNHQQLRDKRHQKPPKGTNRNKQPKKNKNKQRTNQKKTPHWQPDFRGARGMKSEIHNVWCNDVSAFSLNKETKKLIRQARLVKAGKWKAESIRFFFFFQKNMFYCFFGG